MCIRDRDDMDGRMALCAKAVDEKNEIM